MEDEHFSRKGCYDAEGGRSREKTLDLLFMGVFEVQGYRFRRHGKGTEKTLRKGLGSWWRDGYIYRAKSVPFKTKWQRVVSQVFITALNNSVDWLWCVARTTKLRQAKTGSSTCTCRR